jgi:hypothetical protein
MRTENRHPGEGRDGPCDVPVMQGTMGLAEAPGPGNRRDTPGRQSSLCQTFRADPRLAPRCALAIPVHRPAIGAGICRRGWDWSSGGDPIAQARRVESGAAARTLVDSRVGHRRVGRHKHFQPAGNKSKNRRNNSQQPHGPGTGKIQKIGPTRDCQFFGHCVPK